MKYLEENVGWYHQSLKEKNGVWHVTVKQYGDTIFDSEVKSIINTSRELKITTTDDKEWVFVKPLCEITYRFNN